MIYLLLFYLAKHNYEPGLNGAGRELCVRKDIYGQVKLDDNSYNSQYAITSFDSWLNTEYKSRFSPEMQELMGTTKFYYTIGGGNWTVGTLERTFFIPSITEFGNENAGANANGTKIDFLSGLKAIGVLQFSRTCLNNTSYGGYAGLTATGENLNAGAASPYMYARIVCSLSPAAMVDDNLNVIDPGLS